MPDRERLDVLLAGHADQVPAIPFAAWRDGTRFDVTAVLERTSVIMAGDGQRGLARHETLLTDPGQLTWLHAPAGWRFTGPTLKDSGQARTLRARSDERARDDKERHGAPESPDVPPMTPVTEESDHARLLRLLAEARREVDELRDEAEGYALALRSAMTGRLPADPPPARRRRHRWDAPPTSDEAILDELVRTYALADEPGRLAVERRTALRRLLHRGVPESRAETA